MSGNQSLVLLVLLGLIAVLGVVYWLRSRPRTAPGTQAYKWAIMIAIALIVVAAAAPMWILVLKAIRSH